MQNGESEGLARSRSINVGTSSIASASTLEEIETQLAHLHTRHATLTQNLDAAVAAHADMTRTLNRLDLSRARLAPVSASAHSLQTSKLAPAAGTARRISQAVQKLDVEQSRVRETLRVVEQVAELKSCVLGVVGSMGGAQDWETAASYCARAERIPVEVRDSEFANLVCPTAETPDPPGVTLENAKRDLCALYVRGFEKAVKEGDGHGITRFFKMFPLIGRSEVGLDAYGRYVCGGVAERARARLQEATTVTEQKRRTDANASAFATLTFNGAAFVDAWTKLFEHIAQVVDGHEQTVTRHYGPGTMTRVMERLHAEADVRGGIVLDTWFDEMAIERKLTEVKSYAYTFLVQSFLPVPGGGGSALGGISNTSTPRTQSPAKGGRVTRENDQRSDGIEMKEIDRCLNEIGGMLSSWGLYVRFISSRVAHGDDPDENSVRSSHEALPEDLPPLMIPAFIPPSALPPKISKHLVEPFDTMSTFFLRRSIERAFQLDESPVSQLSLSLSRNLPPGHDATATPFITSSVDDIMYIVQAILQRTLATSHTSLAHSNISMTGRVLGSDFIGMVQRKLRDECYPSAPIPGAAPPEGKVLAFLVLLNNLDVAVEFLYRIVSAHTGPNTPGPDSYDHYNSEKNDGKHHVSGQQVNGTNTKRDEIAIPRALQDLFPISDDAQRIFDDLQNLLLSFGGKATDLALDGLSIAFSNVVKPRIRPFFNELFKEVDYGASEENEVYPRRSVDGFDADDHNEGEHYSNNGTTASAAGLRPRFTSGWIQLTRPVTRLLTPRNATRFTQLCVTYSANLLERRLWNLAPTASATAQQQSSQQSHMRTGALSELGAVLLERDVVDIANEAVRSATASRKSNTGDWKLRGAFKRCLDIVSIASMEEEEWIASLQEEEASRQSEQGTNLASSNTESSSRWTLTEEERNRARLMVRERALA